MTSFEWDYLLFVFISACGVLQMVAAYKGLQGILFLRNRYLAFGLGLVATMLSFVWFFVSEPRNIADTAEGLSGNEQFGFFSLAAGCATLFTLLLSSLRNRKLGSESDRFQPGLDALRETNYLRALLSTLKSMRKRW